MPSFLTKNFFLPKIPFLNSTFILRICNFFRSPDETSCKGCLGWDNPQNSYLWGTLIYIRLRTSIVIDPFWFFKNLHSLTRTSLNGILRVANLKWVLNPRIEVSDFLKIISFLAENAHFQEYDSSSRSKSWRWLSSKP